MLKRASILLFALALAACSKPHAVQAPAASAPGTTPQYAYVVVPAPSAASSGPKILEVDLFAREYRAPAPIGVRVHTSSDVTTVTARLLGRERAVPKTGDGMFEAVEQLPDVPFFLKGRDYTVDFVAATNDGRTTDAQVTVHLDR